MKTLPTLLIVILSFQIVYSQDTSDSRLVAGPEWFDGSLLLNTGREIKGLIKYNDKSDIVSIENGRESKSFTARHVKGFEFFDEIEKKQRVFYAVDIEDRFYKVKRPLFFEILMELKEFAVLSKIAPIHMEKKEYATPAIFNPANGAFSAGRYYGYPSTISFTERVFLLSSKGELKPYLEITEKEIDGMFYDRSIVKNKILDEDLLKRLTSSYYPQLMTYAAKNDIDLKEKDGLLSVLSYYKDISK
jgi:hypothetical protein